MELAFKAKEEVLASLKSQNYDIVLADVNLNANPSTLFMQDYMYMTEKITNIYNQMLEEKDIIKLQSLLQQYITLLSEEVSAIGIYAKVGYVVVQKSVLDMTDISYMNIFKVFN